MYGRFRSRFKARARKVVGRFYKKSRRTKRLNRVSRGGFRL